MVACACGERRILACSMRGRVMSKLYLARPVAFSTPSRRGTFVPISRRVAGHGMVSSPAACGLALAWHHASAKPQADVGLCPLLIAQGVDRVAHLFVGAAAADVA